jgi:hypothetical protein
MKSQGALVYWFDLAPDIDDKWVDWYIRDHMPSRVGATFSAAHCFRAVGAKSAFLALYEAETAEALLAPEYLAMLRKPSMDDRLRRGWYLNTVRAPPAAFAPVWGEASPALFAFRRRTLLDCKFGNY